jgi:hypothetical protein
MSDELDRATLDAARKYHDAPAVPKDEIWERIESARRPRRAGSWRRVTAAAALLIAGGAIALAGESLFWRMGGTSADDSPRAPIPGVVATYLASSDSLLTVFRLAGEGDRIRADVATWARDLASRTRGAERSLARKDTTLRRLLGDLDLVLIQIAQYAASPDARPIERSLIVEALATRDLASQLRETLRRGSTGG